MSHGLRTIGRMTLEEQLAEIEAELRAVTARLNSYANPTAINGLPSPALIPPSAAADQAKKHELEVKRDWLKRQLG